MTLPIRQISNKLILTAFSIGLIIYVTEAILSTNYVYRILPKISKLFLQEKLSLSVKGSDVLGQNSESLPDWMTSHTLHPYIGFVGDFKKEKEINSFGWFGEEPTKTHDDNTVTIGIFGGSVAADLYYKSKNVFIEELQKYDSFQNKKLRVVSVSLGGYKQPQQLQALTYLLSQGYQFDYVINIDGFNEIALPLSDNVPNNIPLDYPRYWNLYSTLASDENKVLYFASVSNQIKTKLAVAEIFHKPILFNSSLALLTWNFIDTQIQKSLSQSIKNTPSLPKIGQNMMNNLPYDKLIDLTRDSLEKSSDIWMNSSIQMSKICEANNITYIHILQPNQYYLNLKNFTEAEKQIFMAISDSTAYIYKFAVIYGYPMLINRSKTLLKQNVHFYDLTDSFVNIQNTVYIDSCCHYNIYGSSIVMTHLAQLIASTFPKPNYH
jgi:hypothetical protein